jgi:hypothetical protein
LQLDKLSLSSVIFPGMFEGLTVLLILDLKAVPIERHELFSVLGSCKSLRSLTLSALAKFHPWGELEDTPVEEVKLLHLERLDISSHSVQITHELLSSISAPSGCRCNIDYEESSNNSGGPSPLVLEPNSSLTEARAYFEQLASRRPA